MLKPVLEKRACPQCPDSPPFSLALEDRLLQILMVWANLGFRSNQLGLGARGALGRLLGSSKISVI